jgi:hypothetical protein
MWKDRNSSVFRVQRSSGEPCTKVGQNGVITKPPKVPPGFYSKRVFEMILVMGMVCLNHYGWRFGPFMFLFFSCGLDSQVSRYMPNRPGS